MPTPCVHGRTARCEDCLAFADGLMLTPAPAPAECPGNLTGTSAHCPGCRVVATLREENARLRFIADERRKDTEAAEAPAPAECYHRLLCRCDGGIPVGHYTHHCGTSVCPRVCPPPAPAEAGPDEDCRGCCSCVEPHHCPDCGRVAALREEIKGLRDPEEGEAAHAEYLRLKARVSALEAALTRCASFGGAKHVCFRDLDEPCWVCAARAALAVSTTVSTGGGVHDPDAPWLPFPTGGRGGTELRSARPQRVLRGGVDVTSPPEPSPPPEPVGRCPSCGGNPGDEDHEVVGGYDAEDPPQLICNRIRTPPKKKKGVR